MLNMMGLFYLSTFMFSLPAFAMNNEECKALLLTTTAAMNQVQDESMLDRVLYQYTQMIYDCTDPLVLNRAFLWLAIINHKKGDIVNAISNAKYSLEYSPNDLRSLLFLSGLSYLSFNNRIDYARHVLMLSIEELSGVDQFNQAKDNFYLDKRRVDALIALGNAQVECYQEKYRSSLLVAEWINSPHIIKEQAELERKIAEKEARDSFRSAIELGKRIGYSKICDAVKERLSRSRK